MTKICNITVLGKQVDSSWNVMAHDDAREGKWRGNWRMEWVANTLHTTSEHGVSSITTADPHTSAASSRLNWRPRRFKWIRPFRRKTNSGFCACAITFQLVSTKNLNDPVFTLQASRNMQRDTYWYTLYTHRTVHKTGQVYSKNSYGSKWNPMMEPKTHN
jgi:hypothetical protein